MKWGTTGMAMLLLAAPVAVHAAGPPVFHRDVMPVVQARCAGCHDGQGIGPFSLVDFAQARKRAGQMSRAVADGLMPPWLPAGGAWKWDRRATPIEAAALRHWAESGAAEGAAAEPSPGPKPGWALGRPGEVLKAKPFTVPAEGGEAYVYYLLPRAAAVERAVRAVELLPGASRVRAGALLLLDRSGTARALAGEAGRYESYGGPGFLPAGCVEVFSPGRPARALDGGSLPLAEDADVVLLVHYRTRGEVVEDAPQVGLYFAENMEGRAVGGVFLGCEAIRVAPGAEATVRDLVKLPVPLRATDIRARMLKSGAALRAWAELPDGKKIELLRIEDWQREWEETWHFAEPPELPAGTRIRAEWHYSNRTDREVRAGLGAEDETAWLWLGGSVDGWPAHVALSGMNLTHALDLAAEARK